MSIVKVEHLKKSFGNFHAVNDVSFQAEEGSLVTLLGPSGCGKTTLLRSIAGFYEPDGGSIFFDDRKMNGIPPNRRNTAMCFQSYALFPHMSVWNNLAFGLKTRKLPKDEIERRVRSALKLVNLEGYEKRKSSQLSGGQQQRVALGRAIVTQPDVLLLDEPLSNLDARMRVKVRQEIRDMQQELGVTALYVTHDQAEALAISDVIIVMNEGQLQQKGTPREVYERPVNAFVAFFLGAANIHSGEVKGIEDTLAVVESPMGELRMPHEGRKPGDKIRFTWRPERAEFCNNDLSGTETSGFKDNIVEGRVSNVIFMGETAELSVISGSEKFNVQSPGHLIVSKGKTIHLRLEPDCLKILEEADQ